MLNVRRRHLNGFVILRKARRYWLEMGSFGKTSQAEPGDFQKPRAPSTGEAPKRKTTDFADGTDERGGNVGWVWVYDAPAGKGQSGLTEESGPSQASEPVIEPVSEPSEVVGQAGFCESKTRAPEGPAVYHSSTGRLAKEVRICRGTAGAAGIVGAENHTGFLAESFGAGEN